MIYYLILVKCDMDCMGGVCLQGFGRPSQKSIHHMEKTSFTLLFYCIFDSGGRSTQIFHFHYKHSAVKWSLSVFYYYRWCLWINITAALNCMLHFTALEV